MAKPAISHGTVRVRMRELNLCAFGSGYRQRCASIRLLDQPPRRNRSRIDPSGSVVVESTS
jgi:hypothetical protein